VSIPIFCGWLHLCVTWNVVDITYVLFDRVELKKQVVRPVRNSPRWESLLGSEFSWRESRSSYNTLRLLVQPVVEAQGKGGVVADGLVLVKVYPPGVEQACGEWGSVGCGRKWLLG
jgi:hypothetical protein